MKMQRTSSIKPGTADHRRQWPKLRQQRPQRRRHRQRQFIGPLQLQQSSRRTQQRHQPTHPKCSATSNHKSLERQHQQGHRLRHPHQQRHLLPLTVLLNVAEKARAMTRGVVMTCWPPFGKARRIRSALRTRVQGKSMLRPPQPPLKLRLQPQPQPQRLHQPRDCRWTYRLVSSTASQMPQRTRRARQLPALKQTRRPSRQSLRENHPLRHHLHLLTTCHETSVIRLQNQNRSHKRRNR